MGCNTVLRATTLGTIGIGLLVGLGAQASPVPNDPLRHETTHANSPRTTAARASTSRAADVPTPSVASTATVDAAPDTDAQTQTTEAVESTNPDNHPLPVTPWQSLTVKPGDTLSRLFVRAGLRPGQWSPLLKLSDAVDSLRDLQPGTVLNIRKTPDNRLAELRTRLGPLSTLSVTRDDDALHASIQHKKTTTRRLSAHGTVNKSLARALARGGVPASVAAQLAHIFSYRADLSMHSGDRFSVIYDAQFADGKQVAAGKIVAARITTDGKTLNAFRATTADGRTGYFDRDGKSLKPAISRHPVDYTRISSPFNLHRLHPILGIRLPHRGVDMAARRGTPIHAAASGVVKFVGRAAGYGHLIKLRHFDGYTTRYGHMFRFAKGLEKGDHVKAGQIIGYVGATGVATGTHLHFEIRKNGIAHNPMTMTLPDGRPLPDDQLAVFENRIQPLVAKLEAVPGMPNTLIAANAGLRTRRNCTQAGTVNAALALAPASVLDDHSLNELFCVITEGPSEYPILAQSTS